MNKEQEKQFVKLLSKSQQQAIDGMMWNLAAGELKQWIEAYAKSMKKEALTAPAFTREKFLEIVNDSDNYEVCAGYEFSLKYDWDKIFEKLTKLRALVGETV